MHTLIGGRIRRTKPRRRVLDYLKGLLSPIQRKNGWQLAVQTGDPNSDGVQRLLATYEWCADLVGGRLAELPGGAFGASLGGAAGG